MDDEPRAHLGAFLGAHHHAVLLKLERSRFGHHAELGPAAEQGKVTTLELASGAAGNEVNKGLALQIPEAVRWPQTTGSNAEWRQIRGFMRWTAHLEPSKTA